VGQSVVRLELEISWWRSRAFLLLAHRRARGRYPLKKRTPREAASALFRITVRGFRVAARPRKNTRSEVIHCCQREEPTQSDRRERCLTGEEERSTLRRWINDRSRDFHSPRQSPRGTRARPLIRLREMEKRLGLIFLKHRRRKSRREQN